MGFDINKLLRKPVQIQPPKPKQENTETIQEIVLPVYEPVVKEVDKQKTLDTLREK